ncbi:uncharacterized protein JCM10292_005980 [Rhodotorula paludigena]|uniref:uncharacterized protein n=1 Tax=Rhodotorula paludigena TaxID=86838 RepID=UPI00317494C7
MLLGSGTAAPLKLEHTADLSSSPTRWKKPFSGAGRPATSAGTSSSSGFTFPAAPTARQRDSLAPILTDTARPEARGSSPTARAVSPSRWRNPFIRQSSSSASSPTTLLSTSPTHQRLTAPSHARTASGSSDLNDALHVSRAPQRRPSDELAPSSGGPESSHKRGFSFGRRSSASGDGEAGTGGALAGGLRKLRAQFSHAAPPAASTQHEDDAGSATDEPRVYASRLNGIAPSSEAAKPALLNGHSRSASLASSIAPSLARTSFGDSSSRPVRASLESSQPPLSTAGSPAPASSAPSPRVTTAPPHLRKKSSFSAVKALLGSTSPSASPAGTGGSAGTRRADSPSSDAGEALDPLTDAELASWRRAGRERRAAARSGSGSGGGGETSEDEVIEVLGEAARLGPRAGPATANERRGSITSQDSGDVLIIGQQQGPQQPASPALSTHRSQAMRSFTEASSAASSVRKASSPRSSAVPLFPNSPRSSSQPFLGSRRSSSAAAAARPNTAPVERRSSRVGEGTVDSGVLNVLEFVAVDAGGDGEEALPLHFPQTHSTDESLFPSAISPKLGPPPSPSLAVLGSSPPKRGHLRRRSTSSSQLSLGSEEDMILSTLGGFAGLGLSSSPSSASSSPVLPQQPFIAPSASAAEQSSLPASMQQLFSTPPKIARPKTDGAPLSSPSKRAARPSPIQVEFGSRRLSTASLASPVSPSTPPPRPARAPGRLSRPVSGSSATPPQPYVPSSQQETSSARSPSSPKPAAVATVHSISTAPPPLPPSSRRALVRPRIPPSSSAPRSPPARPSRSKERARARAALEGNAVSTVRRPSLELVGERYSAEGGLGGWCEAEKERRKDLPPTPPGSDELRHDCEGLQIDEAGRRREAAAIAAA